MHAIAAVAEGDRLRAVRRDPRDQLAEDGSGGRSQGRRPRVGPAQDQFYLAGGTANEAPRSDTCVSEANAQDVVAPSLIQADRAAMCSHS